MTGSVNIHAPRDAVWEYMTSPEFVSEYAPGLKSIEVVVPDKQFKASIEVAIGSAKVTFETTVEFMEMYMHRFARMKAHGLTPGSGVDVTREMRLTTQNGTTSLDWIANIIVVGTLASTAARQMQGITRNLTDAFFNCAKGKIEG
jgi:carbon monoxide dehydrogenase subunit G